MYNSLNPLPAPFPVGALPSMIQDAVYDAQRQTSAPLELCVASALSSVSLVAQHGYDVERPGGLVSPVSLFTLSIAESGERKSTVDALFTRPIKDFVSQKRDEFEAEISAFNVESELWQREKNALTKPKRNRQGEMDEETIRNKLIELESCKPVPPQLLQLVYSDTTQQALLEGLRSSWPSAGLLSHEGGVVLEGAALRSAAHFNALWGGDEVQINRKSAESFILNNPRLTISLMVQPKVFQRFMQKNGEAMGDIGLLARFLIAWPTSTQGTRHQNIPRLTDVIYDDPDYRYVMGPGLDAFHRRISHLLGAVDWSNPKAKKQALVFSVEAERLWKDFEVSMEYLLAPNSYYSVIKPFVAKAAEHCARVAALFHLCVEGQGEISSKSMQQAIDVVKWFLEEHRRVLGGVSVPLVIQDAEVLIKWIYDQSYRLHISVFRVSDLSRKAPNQLRKNGRFHAALEQLVLQGRLLRQVTPNRSGRYSRWVSLPQYTQSYHPNAQMTSVFNQPN
jgi:hypothetical protein